STSIPEIGAGAAARAVAPPLLLAAMAGRAAVPGGRAGEPLAAVHPAADRDLALDAGPAPGRPRRLPPAAGLGPPRGRLPDDPGGHLLPWRLPRRHGLRRHRPPGAPVRAGAGPEPDDVDFLRGRLGRHPPVRPRPEH